MRPHLTVEQRRLVLRLKARGLRGAARPGPRHAPPPSRSPSSAGPATPA